MSMLSNRFVWASWIITAAAAAPAAAQDMSVYTTVSLVGRSAARPQVVARPLTLFHAGKVYDYMEDIGEVVIFEPIHNRFVVLGPNYLAARVDQAELEQFLKVAEIEAHNYLRELQSSRDRKQARLAALLEFQLAPQFEERSDPTRLRLTAPLMSYDVRTARLAAPQLTEQYLTYADWAARLNFVLHPQATYPGPRLRLNASLRQKGLLPTTVELTSRADGDARVLRAEHRFEFDLQANDKTLINKWERLLESDLVQWVGFHEYQQRLIAGLAKGNR
jgi:hypothetical protein